MLHGINNQLPIPGNAISEQLEMYRKEKSPMSDFSKCCEKLYEPIPFSYAGTLHPLLSSLSVALGYNRFDFQV